MVGLADKYGGKKHKYYHARPILPPANSVLNLDLPD